MYHHAVNMYHFEYAPAYVPAMNWRSPGLSLSYPDYRC